jgi:thioredoxin reductase
MYDAIIIGGGPAGLVGAIYAEKNKLKTLVLSKETPAYQSAVSNSGFFGMFELSKEFESELKLNPEYLEFKNNQEAVSLEKNIVSFAVEVKSGKIYYSKTVIIASGQDQGTGLGNTAFELLTHKDTKEKIKVDEHMRTNVPGIFAAGGATTTLSGDIFLSAAEGGKAALSALKFLKPA